MHHRRYLFLLAPLALASVSSFAQAPFSLSYTATEEHVVELSDARLVESLSDYELSGIQYVGPVEYHRVEGYAPERGLYAEKTYLDPAAAGPDWIETPVARIVEGDGRIAAYGPHGDEIAAHDLSPSPDGARAAALAAAERGGLLPFALELAPSPGELDALRAEGYAVSVASLDARNSARPAPPGGIGYRPPRHGSQDANAVITARAADHALIYDVGGRTKTSIRYDGLGRPVASLVRGFRAVAIPGGATGFVEVVAVSSTLDTLLSGAVVTRTTLTRSRDYAFSLAGRAVFDLRREGAAGGGDADALTVFPNPLTADRLQVVIPHGAAGGEAVIDLFDATGRLLTTQTSGVTPGGLISVGRPSGHRGGSLLVVVRQGDQTYRQVVITP